MSQYKTKSERIRFYKDNKWRGKNGMRNFIYDRDNGECQHCKKNGFVTTKGTKLEVHHIKELEYYPALALEEENLILICINCHNAIHDRYVKGGKSA